MFIALLSSAWLQADGQVCMHGCQVYQLIMGACCCQGCAVDSLKSSSTGAAPRWHVLVQDTSKLSCAQQCTASQSCLRRFASLIGTRESAEHMWRITKDENQHSKVTKEPVFG